MTLKVQSTEITSEKYTLRWEEFSSSNTVPNQIIRFHPRFLQLRLCKQSSEVLGEKKLKSSGRKRTKIKLSQNGTYLFQILWYQVFFFAQKLHIFVTFCSSSFWTINTPIRQILRQRQWKYFINNYLKLSEKRSSFPVRKDACQNTFFSFWVLEVKFTVILRSFRQVS